MAHVKSFSFSDCDEQHTNDNYRNRLNEIQSQVRILLFKECRFKERKLLFDSLAQDVGTRNVTKKFSDKKFTKSVSNHNQEFYQITEMIFGSTAMRYNDTYFKVHSIYSPQSIIFTQVFSTPHRGIPAPINSSQQYLPNYSQEKFSLTSQLSMKSSETSSNLNSFSIFREPSEDYGNSSSTTVDSGFSDRSFSSISSSKSFPNRCSRGSSLYSLTEESLDFSQSFLTQSDSSSDFYRKPSCDFTRLGLALIITIAAERNLVSLMAYQAVCRFCCQYAKYFLSLMAEISNDSAHWLVGLIRELNVVWTNGTRNTEDTDNLESTSFLAANGPHLMLSHLSRIFHDKWKALKINKLFHRDRNRFQRCCELVTQVNVKDKKFFVTALLTAVLSHHLGWVATCCTNLPEHKEIISRNSFNAIWCQMRDLSVSLGRTSKIILYGPTNTEIIEEVMNLLRYFVRYFKVQKREIGRADIVTENEVTNKILKPNSHRLKQNMGKCNPKGLGLGKSKLVKSKRLSNLADMIDTEENFEYTSNSDEQPVLFILGDNEKLVNPRKSDSTLHPHEEAMKELRGMCTTGNPHEYTFHDGKSSMAVNQMDQQEGVINWNINRSSNEVTEKAEVSKMRVFTFPLPQVNIIRDFRNTVPYEFSMKDAADRLVPDMIIQGTSVPESSLKSKLKYFMPVPSYSYDDIDEAAVILGNIDKWEVEVWSGKRNSLSKSFANGRVEASPLVSDMLDILAQMWNLQISQLSCTTHMEQRLLEIFLRSSALAHFLLATDFCTMDLLASCLGLDANDIPLLLSVVSHLHPEVSKKYGWSYQ